MAIEFKCLTCGKELFAQDQYAGMRTTCPGCQSKMPIPFPSPISAGSLTSTSDAQSHGATPVTPADSGDQPAPPPPSPGAPPVPSAAPVAPTAPQPTEAGTLIDTEKVAPARSSELAKPVAEQAKPEPTKRCPMCAETILRAAKKCRYCGEILDDDLKQEAVQAKRNAAAMATLMVARRSDGIWRGVSILATMLTTGWLILQTLNCIVLKNGPSLTFLAPWPVYLFNVLLIGGLFTLIRQMKNGPAHVFLAAAIAIVVCMPLDMCLGFPLQGIDQFMLEAKKQEYYKDWTLPDFYTLFSVLSGIIGVMISLPVWFTALKIALQARLANRAK